MKTRRGFTLIELMIVVLVIAVLAGLAFSGYQNQVRKSRRAEAKQALSHFTLQQEKFRSNNTTYGTCNQVAGNDPASTTACASYNSGLAFYTVAVTANDGVSYTMTATPKTTEQAKDSCGTLTVLMASGTLTKCPANVTACTVKSPTDCW